ncbi:MAG: SH3 domain-containing protein [Nitrospira sp.]|nr:SH3 domain-containing protein [Nitrospira sp.]
MKDYRDFPTLQILKEIKNSPTMRLMRTLENSPAMKMLRQLEESSTMASIRRLEDSSSMRAIRQLENSPVMLAMRELEDSPANAALKKLEESPAMEAIRNLRDSPALSAIRAIQNLPVMRAFSEVADRLAYAYGPLTLRNAYNEIIRSYEQASATSSIDPLEAVFADVQKQAGQSPSEALSAEFFLSLVFAFFLFSLSKMEASDSEDRIVRQIKDLEDRIVQQLETLQASEQNDTFYVVERPLNLRAGAGIKHEVMEVLPFNLKVRATDRQAHWVKVEYYDHLERKIKTGWVDERYLVLIGPRK